MTKAIFLYVSVFIFCVNVNAQFISGDGFLKGEFIEVGIASNGTINSFFGPPAGYKGYSPLGVCADVDRVGPGIPGHSPYSTDFVANGSPIEMWFIKSSGISGTADYNAGKKFLGDLSGSINSVSKRHKEFICSWEGIMDSLSIQQEISVHDLGLTVMFKIRLKNLSSLKKDSIYYGRMVDPDVIGHVYTGLKIVKQLPNPENESYVTARGLDPRYVFGIRSNDPRAKVYYYKIDLLPRYGVDHLSTGIGLDTAFVAMNVGDSLFNDVSMGINFDVGSIKPGDSTEFTFKYEFAERGDCYKRLVYNRNIYQNGDTILTCPETQSVDLQSVGYDSWKWEFSPYVDTGFGFTSVNVTDSITITAIHESNGLCPDDTFNLTFRSFPIVMPVVIKDLDLLYIDSSYHKTFAWFQVGSPYLLSKYASLKPKKAGYYYVRVLDYNSCTQYSDTVYMDTSLGMIAINTEDKIAVTPNPSRGKLTILSGQLYNITVSDISGRILLKSAGKSELDISSFTQGVYIVQLSDEDGQIRGRKKIYKLD